MTPYDRAELWHDALGCDWTFAQIISAHGGGGFIHSTPDVFVLARQVHSDWHPDEFRDPRAMSNTGDCWHVWLLAGDPWDAFGYLPFDLPFVSYHRRGKLRVRPLAAVRSAFAP